MQLTPCQQKAKGELEAWLLDSSRPEFILSGGAGVGKSTLLNLILKDMNQINEMCQLLDVDQRLYDVLFTATTNKAASVINGETIFSLLGITLYNNWETGEVQYNVKNAKDRYNSLIIVDESSMVSDTVLKLINTYCNKCKVLYVGDKNQLHPVGLDYSPVFDSDIELVHMNTQCRQDANTHLYKVISDVQRWVETGVQCKLEEGDGVTYIHDAGLVDFIATSSNVGNNPNEIPNNDKIITYTNKGSIQLNEFVRFKRNLSSTFFEEGEPVLSCTTLPTKDKYKKIITDGQYIIRNISSVKDCGGMFNYYEATLNGIPVEAVENPIQFANVLKKLKSEKNWQTYFTLKERFVDLRDAYAITTHKSQGSTYDRVLINLSNFKRCQDKSMLARLLYVALSRARSEVFLYGSL
jgi:hypothetical protein